MRKDMPKDDRPSKVKGDAEGQFAPGHADRNASGVASAKPTVITGSEDAPAHNVPPDRDNLNR